MAFDSNYLLPFNCALGDFVGRCWLIFHTHSHRPPPTWIPLARWLSHHHPLEKCLPPPPFENSVNAVMCLMSRWPSSQLGPKFAFSLCNLHTCMGILHSAFPICLFPFPISTFPATTHSDGRIDGWASQKLCG